MNYEQVKHKFGLWSPYFRKFIESPEFDLIFQQIKQRVNQGAKIAPESLNTFRCFLETPPDKLKVIFASFCPYHTFVDGKPIADGLAFSCSNNKHGVQPSLSAIYSAIEKDIFNGLNVNMDLRNDLSYLAKEEGVLLYNTGLTVEMSKAGSMQDIWTNFNKYFFEEVINKFFTGIPIVLFGKEAQKSEAYISPVGNYIFKIQHPAAASYSKGAVWNHEEIFKKINYLLESNNGKGYSIRWFRLTTDETCPF